MADTQRVMNEGEKRLLERAVKAAAVRIHLFKNNVTVTNSLAAAAFTPPTFSGYTYKTVATTDWGSASTNAEDRGDIEAVEKEWAYTGAAEEQIYGYYVADAADGVPLWVHKFETARQVVGDGTFAVTARLLAYDPTDV